MFDDGWMVSDEMIVGELWLREVLNCRSVQQELNKFFFEIKNINFLEGGRAGGRCIFAEKRLVSI